MFVLLLSLYLGVGWAFCGLVQFLQLWWMLDKALSVFHLRQVSSPRSFGGDEANGARPPADRPKLG